MKNASVHAKDATQWYSPCFACTTTQVGSPAIGGRGIRKKREVVLYYYVLHVAPGLLPWARTRTSLNLGEIEGVMCCSRKLAQLSSAQLKAGSSRVHSTIFRVSTYTPLNDEVLTIQVVPAYIRRSHKCWWCNWVGSITAQHHFPALPIPIRFGEWFKFWGLGKNLRNKTDNTHIL